MIRWLALVLALAGSAGHAAAQSARPVGAEAAVHEVAAELRCVVCQNLSVADSPSEMAGQMRAIIRERLAAGESPAQVRQYFVDRYGEWILLSPPRRGFNLVVWLLPLAVALAGLAVVVLVVRRWTRRRADAVSPRRQVDAAMSERIRREVDQA